MIIDYFADTITYVFAARGSSYSTINIISAAYYPFCLKFLYAPL